MLSSSRAVATVNRRGVQVCDVLLQRALGGELAVLCVELRRGQAGTCTWQMHVHVHGVYTHVVCTARAWHVQAMCRPCAGRVQAVCMLRTLLQRSARVLDRIVRVLQPVGHLLTKQVPREEA